MWKWLHYMTLHCFRMFIKLYKVEISGLCWRNGLKMKEREYWEEMLIKIKYIAITKKLTEERNRINFSVLRFAILIFNLLNIITWYTNRVPLYGKNRENISKIYPSISVLERVYAIPHNQEFLISEIPVNCIEKKL